MSKRNRGKGGGSGRIRVRANVVSFEDTTTSFRSAILRVDRDGARLVAAFDRLARVHPQVAASVVSTGSLGEISRRNAIDSVRVYANTGVAASPVRL